MAKRKKFDSKTKIGILKKYLQKKEPVSNLCEEHGCTPGSVYQWQEVLFDRGHLAFENKTGRPVNEKARDEKIREMEQSLSNKNEVISKLLEELIQAKKSIGAI